MFERQTQIKLIKYEIEHIRYFDRQETNLREIFGPMEWVPEVPCQDFELLYLVLDDMGVPPDSSDEPRDDYNNLYSELYWSKTISDAKISKFINDILSLKERKENEKKKRIRKQ